jgi:hypothetical protein
MIEDLIKNLGYIIGASLILGVASSMLLGTFLFCGALVTGYTVAGVGLYLYLGSIGRRK